MALDPCREWLGIDAVDLVDARRVLGLSSGNLDAATIARAAATRLEAVRRIAPGPFAKAHAAIIARIVEARDELIAAAGPATAPPATRLRAAVFVPPPPPPATPPPPPPPPASTKPGETFAASALVFATPAATPSAAHDQRRPRRSPKDGWLVLGAIGLLCATVVVLALLVMKPDVGDGFWPGSPSPDPAAIAVRQGGSPRNAGDPAGSAGGIQPDGRDPQRTGRGQDEMQSGTQSAELDTAGRTDEAERTALEASLREAYAALQRQDFDTADRVLAAAARRVGDDVEAATRLERWRLFATYARGFVGYREQAFAAANAGREYEADGKRFAIIEINASQFIYRRDGRTERVPRHAVDPAIEMAIVATWFARDGRAANHLFLGARWLCLHPPNPRKALSEWQSAGSGGETVAPLLALLDDPVIQQAGR